jgi:DNA-binding NarL/FixJ family response regulator
MTKRAYLSLGSGLLGITCVAHALVQTSSSRKVKNEVARQGVYTVAEIRALSDEEWNMTNLSDLTPRELEILQLVLTGLTNKAIAGEICISEKTVEFHLGHIYTKVGAHTRLMAGVWAIQHGIEANTREIPS